MPKAGERAGPRCPVCGKRLRVKPGTKRTTLVPLWQCREGLASHPESCEWTNAMLQLLLAEQSEEGADNG